MTATGIPPTTYPVHGMCSVCVCVCVCVCLGGYIPCPFPDQGIPTVLVLTRSRGTPIMVLTGEGVPLPYDLTGVPLAWKGQEASGYPSPRKKIGPKTKAYPSHGKDLEPVARGTPPPPPSLCEQIHTCENSTFPSYTGGNNRPCKYIYFQLEVVRTMISLATLIILFAGVTLPSALNYCTEVSKLVKARQIYWKPYNYRHPYFHTLNEICTWTSKHSHSRLAL